MPSTLGATDFPTKRIKTIMVKIYGSIASISEGIEKLPPPNIKVKACENPNNKQAP